MMPIYTVIGLVPAGLLGYNLLLFRTVGEPLVMTESDRFQLAGALPILIVLPIKAEVKINKLQVKLKCDQTTKTKSGGKSTITTSNYYKKEATLAKDRQVVSGEPVSGTHSFTIPANQSPSNSEEYPLHDWYIEVLMDIAGRPDYRGRFPIRVEKQSGADQ
jgi:hypothetical protein